MLRSQSSRLTTTLIISILCLSGCSGFIQPQHLSADWYKIGWKDAQSGFSESWRENYHKIGGGTPEGFDANQYQQGFTEGKSCVSQQNCIASK